MIASVFGVAALLVTLFILVIHSGIGAAANLPRFQRAQTSALAATSGNQTTFRRCQWTQHTGTATTSPSGVTVLRDASGRTTGTIQLERKTK